MCSLILIWSYCLYKKKILLNKYFFKKPKKIQKRKFFPEKFFRYVSENIFEGLERKKKHLISQYCDENMYIINECFPRGF